MRRDPSFRTVRWIRTLNLLAQAVLLLTLCGGLNYLALHYGWRFDLTATHRHSLSPETISYLRGLKEPVRIVVTIADDADNQPELRKARRDLGDLLDDYAHATERQDTGRVTTEFLDVFQNRREAARLGINQANSLLVLCGDRRRVVSLAELYRIENKEIKSFQGEQAVTAAIVAVTNPVKKKIFFLKGDGEMAPDDVSTDRGLSAVADELRQRNFAVDTLDLTTAPAVPADTDLLVIAGPQGKLLPTTVEQLRQYMRAHAGRMLVLLAPDSPHGLDDLLDDWGVLADDDVINDSSPAGRNDTGDLILTAAAANDHQVIHTLVEFALPVRFGVARSVRPDPGRSTLDTSLVVTSLIGTSATTAWGQRNYREQGVPAYRAGIDLPPPLTVVTAAERVTTGGGLSFNVPGGRLVAFGGTDWIANSRETTPGNLALFLDAVNWAVGRDPRFNIPARPVERLQLALTQQQLQHLRVSLIFVGPAALALLGMLVWWARRR